MDSFDVALWRQQLVIFFVNLKISHEIPKGLQIDVAGGWTSACLDKITKG
jgi:hypothetical protein